MASDITIDSFTGPYAWLSNFYPSPIMAEVYGKVRQFPTGEHYYHALKINAVPFDRNTQSTNELMEYIENFLSQMETADTPGKSKRLGRSLNIDTTVWDRKAFFFMIETSRKKYGQNPELAQRLVDTGQAVLIEGNNHGDKIWGVVNGEGLNLLGEALMIVREELRQGKVPVYFKP